jgi:hypothetical protein
LQSALCLTDKEAEEVVAALVGQGFVRFPSEQEAEEAPVRLRHGGVVWLLTEKGRSLTRAKGNKPVARAAADKALKELLYRVEELNANDDFMLQVTALVAFGSYLSDKDPIGDLDVAYATKQRPHQSEDVYGNYWRLKGSGCEGLKIYEWPSQQARLKLKNRVRLLHIQPWYSFLSITPHPGFQYKVLFGDPAFVEAEIAAERSDKPKT